MPDSELSSEATCFWSRNKPAHLSGPRRLTAADHAQDQSAGTETGVKGAPFKFTDSFHNPNQLVSNYKRSALIAAAENMPHRSALHVRHTHIRIPAAIGVLCIIKHSHGGENQGTRNRRRFSVARPEVKSAGCWKNLRGISSQLL